MAAPGQMYRPAQSLMTGAIDALQLKVWMGETIGAYLRGLTCGQYIGETTIGSGKQWQIPVSGYVDAGKHHVTGEDILLDSGYRQTLPWAERTILLDQPYVINGFIPDIEEFQTHYDTRQRYIQGIAERHARVRDYKTLRVLIKAARAAANITGGGTAASQRTPPGSSAHNAGGNTAPAACTNANLLGASIDGGVIVSALFAAAQRLDEYDIPTDGRIALLQPSQYYALVQNRELLDRDVVRENGDFADGTVFKCANIRLVKCNALATAAVNQAAMATGENNDYSGDFSANAGIVFRAEAAHRIVRRSMEMQMWYEKARFAHVMTTRIYDGFEYLQPEAAVELCTS